MIDVVYYLNFAEIDAKHDFLLWLSQAAEQVERALESEVDTVHILSQERVLHLAIETVTDMGNLLIDGFMMRDPSSYEDIIDILRMEQVLDEAAAAGVLELVRMRKALTQEYILLNRVEMHPFLSRLPGLLTAFAKQCVDYVHANKL